jgi:hypothetical protein
MEVASHVTELRKLLGMDVLLLGWPLGKKGDSRRWKHLTIEAMADPYYLAGLAAGNIGVALGEKSGGLCSLDIDDDDEVAEFLKLNKGIGNTLRTRGSRGCNLWYRLKGSYPGLKHLKRCGQPWGEWRSNGAQTIIHGRHPNGQDYQILNRVTPITVEFSQFIFPEGITSLLEGGTLIHDTERTEQTEPEEQSERTQRTDEDRSGVARGVLLCMESCGEVQQAIVLSMPKHEHESHGCLFTLARAVTALELSRNRKWSMDEKKSVFLLWHEQAKPFLRESQSQDEYWFEFLEAYENVEYPLGKDFITDAWDAANAKEPPDVARQFVDRRMQLLVSFCRELQGLLGERPFFLSCRTVQRLFELESHATGARWLRGLCRTGILKVMEQGSRDTNKATRFRYLPPL